LIIVVFPTELRSAA